MCPGNERSVTRVDGTRLFCPCGWRLFNMMSDELDVLLRYLSNMLVMVVVLL